ncbi:MAG: hypothetical protein AB1758_06850 [Candidatus Eremiobacterota bacterium]
MSRACALVLGLVLSLGAAAWGQTSPEPGTPDARVQATLEALKWPYKTDRDGDYQLVVEMEGKRTQLVLVRSRTYECGHLEVRELWSAAYESNGPVSADLGRSLLEDNLRNKYGSWATLPQEGGQKQLILYVARIPAAADPDTFAAYVNSVALLADDLERDLGGKDDF